MKISSKLLLFPQNSNNNLVIKSAITRVTYHLKEKTSIVNWFFSRNFFSKEMENSFQYPEVRRQENIEEIFFNNHIKDPYRWLEDADSEETLKFVEKQNALSSKYIQSCAYRQKIKERLKELFEYRRYGCPYKKGSNYFMQMNTGLQNQYVLYIMRGNLDTEPQIFFDPNALSEDGTVSLSSYTVDFSHDGKWWAYGLQKSGSDWNTIKIKNVDTGIDLEEELCKVKFSGISWTKDNKGFFYSYYPEQNDRCDGQETTACTFQKLFYHRIGTPQSSDVLIYESTDQPNYRFSPSVSDCGQYLFVYTNRSCEYHLWHFYKFDDPKNPEIKPKLELIPIIDEFKADYYYLTNDGPVQYVRTNSNAPNFKIVRVDLTDSATRLESNWQDLVAEHPKDVLQSTLVVNKDILVCHYISDVISRLQLRKLSDGSLLKEIKIPVGTISSIAAEREHDELFYSFTSFLVPSSIFHLKLDDPVKNEPRCFKESKPKNFDASQFVTKQMFVTSKDGTRVPLFIVHNKNLTQDGSRPCMLYGYGGFTISIQPSFSVTRLILLDNLDGVYALANIRGGGEYGENWHIDGKMLKKQNCFDDFISAAEYLVEHKYTSPKKIIIAGGSNGGLLVGAVANQRPDLFGCTICHVGVLDMLRYHKFTIGHAWMSEYGSPEEEEHFNNLIKYSPLHTIPDSTDNYPATLLLTADHDDRVVPLHSFKFISELQHKLGSKVSVPLMIRIDTKAGHGAGKPTDKVIEEYADIYSFIINSLNLKYKI